VSMSNCRMPCLLVFQQLKSSPACLHQKTTKGREAQASKGRPGSTGIRYKKKHLVQYSSSSMKISQEKESTRQIAASRTNVQLVEGIGAGVGVASCCSLFTCPWTT